jgi:hypothetical protein
MPRANLSAIIGWVGISAASYYYTGWSWWTIFSMATVAMGTLVYLTERQ